MAHDVNWVLYNSTAPTPFIYIYFLTKPRESQASPSSGFLSSLQPTNLLAAQKTLQHHMRLIASKGTKSTSHKSFINWKNEWKEMGMRDESCKTRLKIFVMKWFEAKCWYDFRLWQVRTRLTVWTTTIDQASLAYMRTKCSDRAYSIQRQFPHHLWH